MAKKTVASSPVHDRYFLRSDGGWADQVALDIAAMTPEDQAGWYALLDHLANAGQPASGTDWQKAQSVAEIACFGNPEPATSGIRVVEAGSDDFRQALKQAAPQGSWMEAFKEHVDRLSREAACIRFSVWIHAAARSGIGTLNGKGPNRSMLRAMLWGSTLLRSADCADALRALGVFATQHKTAQGALVALVLAATETEEALAALYLLAQSAKRPSPRERFLRAATHVARRLGLSPDQAAERFVPRYGLDASGTRAFEFGTACAEIRLRDLAVEVQWRDSKGKALKGPPTAVRKSEPSRIAEFRADVKAIGAMVLAQRDRLDRIVVSQRMWAFPYFRSFYLEHPLVGHLARKLIWIADDVPVLFTQDGAICADGQVFDVSDSTQIRSWHPINRPTEEVVAWRQRLELLEITQPFKQAHRELYILTEAERRTRTYSNRFAAHILRQHQFAHLARARGWEYALSGLWDGGTNSSASFRTPGSEFCAEFWVSPVEDGAHSNAFIPRHVATDQVRFCRANGREPIPLDEIPPLILSEVLRDVDLFVGVASVGNDPTWQDGGPDGRYRTYWQSYSFGELSQTAQTRRVVLERLLPRLSKIRERCTLSERFLVVRGELRTYKIHLGSGNILMEPNDQYVCIVPSRSTSDGSSDVFLPFEGDATLSIILSKAFLLADDRKIKDPTITRQIAGS